MVDLFSQRRRFQFGIRTILAAIAVIAVCLWWVTPSLEYKVAVDSNVYWGERVEAAKTLGPIERARLQDHLLTRIYSNNKHALDNISILGAIGNVDALNVLVNFPRDIDISGKINANRSRAIEQIQSRIDDAER